MFILFIIRTEARDYTAEIRLYRLLAPCPCGFPTPFQLKTNSLFSVPLSPPGCDPSYLFHLCPPPGHTLQPGRHPPLRNYFLAIIQASSLAAPSAWNSMPADLCVGASCLSLRTLLKGQPEIQAGYQQIWSGPFLTHFIHRIQFLCFHWAYHSLKWPCLLIYYLCCLLFTYLLSLFQGPVLFYQSIPSTVSGHQFNKYLYVSNACMNVQSSWNEFIPWKLQEELMRQRGGAAWPFFLLPSSLQWLFNSSWSLVCSLIYWWAARFGSTHSCLTQHREQGSAVPPCVLTSHHNRWALVSEQTESSEGNTKPYKLPTPANGYVLKDSLRLNLQVRIAS